MDALAYVLALEEICKADASHGVIMSVNNSLYCHGILKFGTEEQKGKFITPIASGKSIGAYSLTEPQSGSDAATMKSRATRDGDHYVLNGRKSWVTSGPVADYYVVFVMTDPDKQQNGISAFLVEASTPGLTRGKKEPKLGIRASATSELIFEKCRVPVANLLGQEGEGFKVAMTVLDAGRIGIATQALGIAEAAYEAARQYAVQREAFGQPIGAFQSVKHRLAELYGLVEIARANAIHAASREGQADFVKAAAAARLSATEAYDTAARDTIQIHGGIGVTWETGLHLHMRRARSLAVEQGNTLFWEDLLVDELERAGA
jgi:alkylation response protein AidB-like acyl-CoA dehydrogenase